MLVGPASTQMGVMTDMELSTSPTVTLHDGPVAIRPFRTDDAQGVFEAVQESRADASAWLPDLKDTLSVADVSGYLDGQPELWASGRAYNFAIVDVDTDVFLGGCGLTRIHQRHLFANMYYWVRTGRTGQGIATQAVRLLARFGCETLALQRVEIVVPVCPLDSDVTLWCIMGPGRYA